MKLKKFKFVIGFLMFAFMFMLSVDTHAEDYVAGKVYTLYLNPNGGTIARSSLTYFDNGSGPFSPDVPVRDGYFFEGWSLLPNATEATLTQWERNQVSNTLYAVWSVNPRYSSVKYDVTGGINAPRDVAYTYSATEKITLSTSTPSKVGFTFLGWSTDSTSTVATIQPGATWSRSKIGKNVLYAVWERIPGTGVIVYDPATGEQAPDPIAYVQSTTDGVTLSTQVPAKVGYTFEGWATESGAEDPTLQPGDVWKPSSDADTTLFAVWEKNSGTFVLYYGTDGGLNTPAAKELTPVASGTTKLSVLTPKKLGYNFLGWSTIKDATVASYPVGATLSLNQDSDVTLYAVWSLATYSVFYNANGGSGTPASQSYLYELNKSITLSALYPTKAGYDFDHWAPSTTSTEIILPGSEWSCTNVTTTLHAMWVGKKYTFSFDANGGVSTNEPITYSYQPTGTFPVVTVSPTRDGCTFLGWARTADAAKALVGSSFNYAYYSPAKDETFYAVWGADITYDANGGIGAPAKQPYTVGNVSLSSIKPTKPGITFLGWSEDKNATEPTYLSGADFSRNQNANVTLYAIWNNQYKVTYNANGGTGAPDTQYQVNSPEGSVFEIPLITPVWADHTFLGWRPVTDKPYLATVHRGDTFIAPTLETNLYAVWKQDIYTMTGHNVYFDPNGSNISYSAVPFYDNGSPITFYESLYGSKFNTRVGYKLLGWSTTPDSKIPNIWGMQRSFGTTVVYAVWELKPGYCALEYDAQGGLNAPFNEAYPCSSTVSTTVPSTIPTKQGHTFLGWSTDKDSNVVNVNPGSSLSRTTQGVTTLYAVWSLTPDYYSIEYNANGGCLAPNTTAYTYNQDKDTAISSARPVRLGHTFLGWSTDSNSSVADISPGDLWSRDLKENTTLYAIWSPDIYSIVYSLNGGTGTIPSTLFAYSDSDYIPLSKDYPTKFGFHCIGWGKTSTSTDAITDWKANNVVGKAQTSIVYVYAIWEPNEYTISFDPNNGVGENPSVTYTYSPTASSLAVYPVVPTREDYTFLGWSRTSNAITVELNVTFYYPKTTGKDETLYAVWGVNVVYDANGGINPPAKQSYVVSPTGSFNLSTAVPSRPNYTFIGWSEDKNATKADYVKGSAWSRNHTSDSTLYAVWAPVNYYVNYNANGGIGSPDTQNYDYSVEGSILITENRPTKANSFFWGWATTINATQATVQPGDSWSQSNKSTTLYAVWKVIPLVYTISFDANGGINAPETVSYEYAVTGSINLPTTKPTNDGAYFIGWSKDPLAEDTTIKLGSSWSKSSTSTTLYAVWGKGNENLINSTGSDYRDLSLGEDKTQGKVTEYYSDSYSESSNYDLNTSIAVFVTKGSMIKLQVPKTLILGITETEEGTLKSKAEGSYKIGLLGDLGGKQKIRVSFPERVTLVNGTKSIDASISVVKSDWLWADVNPETYTYVNSTIRLSGLTAGSYKGVFNINFVVSIDNL